VDLKASARKAVDNVNTTLEEIKDGNSAQAALPKLQDAGTELDNVIKLSGQLPEAGKKAVGGVVAGAQPATTQLFDKVLAIPGVKEVAKPQIDSLRAKLDTLSKNQARL
jgi:enamine deaminase RidA (YjgF/YER057c/UK114 family)